MAHTYTSLHYHVIFSTKNREPWLTESIRGRLWPYLGGIARENRMNALEVGGVSDHVHALVAIPATLAVAKAVQLIKGGSSIWVKETFRELPGFSWQDGYGAFSVSESQIETVRDYIRRQVEHHWTHI
jgi:putative transposase